MVESLIAGKGTLVHIEDRTRVVNLKEWNITDDDILHICDHGGHFIYSMTTPLFVAKDSLLFLVHDIIKVKPEDINETIEVLRHALHQYPANMMYIILTHTDLIGAHKEASNTKTIIDALNKFLDDEINDLNKLLIERKGDAQSQETADLLECFGDKRSNLPVFRVSSQKYSGMDEVKECLMQVAMQKRTSIPESWVEFYKQIIETEKIYLTLNEISQLFTKASNMSKTSQDSPKSNRLSYIFQKVKQFFRRATHNMPETSSDETEPDCEFLVPLQYFSDSNLCLYYDTNPFMKDFVFPDIDLLVELFKSLFHHNIAQVINYDNNERLRANFEQGECDLAVQRYEKEGLLSQKLLSFLLEHHGFSSPKENVLLPLLKHFNLCYSISKTEELLYIPWLIQSRECPPHIDRGHLMQFDETHASVHLQCNFFNRIPQNVFEMVSVCLQRKATEESHYMGYKRQAWHDGLEVKVGSVRCVLTRSGNTTIDICLYGEVEHMPQVWNVIDSLLQDLQSILKPFKGVIRNIHFVCGHCVVLGKKPPHHWLLCFVFPEEGKKVDRYVNCPEDPSAKIPAALLIHFFKGELLHSMPLNCHSFNEKLANL